MFCIVSFIVLSILSIFSASNRELAREALSCVGRRVTLRPCNTGFDEKMKAKILGVVITRSEKTARFLNKFFEPIAWFFFILFVVALLFFGRGLYLFYTTGSCNGVNAAGFCVFDPTGKNNEVSTIESCKVKPPTLDDLTLQDVDLSLFPTQNPDAADKIVMIGCYHCDYTRKAYPMMTKLIERFPSSFTFLHYPVKESNDYYSKLGYCVNQQAPDKYWQWNTKMFEGDKALLDDPAYIDQMLTGLNIDSSQIATCTNDPATEEAVQKQMTEITKTNFYGTPTIFINGDVFVGPKPFRVYAIALKGFFYWLR